MYLSENDVKQLLIEMFIKFKQEYILDPKPFIVTLANYYGSQIPKEHLSDVKYNLFLDVLKEMYGKN
jgi:hypothetical protein